MPDNTEALARVRELLTNYQYRINGQWFFGQSLRFDGFAFSRCRFDNCHIDVRRGDFVLDHCFFSDCTIFIHDDALTVLRLYNVFSEPPPRFPEHIRPKRHEDGTVSVNKIEE